MVKKFCKINNILFIGFELEEVNGVLQNQSFLQRSLGKPYLKTSFKETLIFNTFEFSETYYSPSQGIQLQHKIFL